MKTKFRAWYTPKQEDALPSGMYHVSKISNKAVIGDRWSDIEEVGLFEPTGGKGGGGFELTVLLEEVALMQFTGAVDKNGKEIFSGDIVSIPIGNEFGSISGGVGRVIRWAEGARFTIINPKDDTLHIDIDEEVSRMIEVIGNIYENSELV